MTNTDHALAFLDGVIVNLKKLIKKESGDRRVASVALMFGSKLLMGKRRDNEKWTVPGGHVDEGESFHEGAVREVMEESGIQIEEAMLESVTEPTLVKEGLTVQTFRVELDEKASTTMKNDPDGEVYRWKWVDITNGLPEEIEQNLHVKMEYNELLKNILRNVKKFDSEYYIMHDKLTLIEGMDYELSYEDVDQTDALKTVIDNLKKDPLHYKKLISSDLGEKYDSNLLRIDLGSGAIREPGYLGFDLFPHDYGTIVHDLALGIPLAQESCERVLLRNTFDVLPLCDTENTLREIERVLAPGGIFIYEGNVRLHPDCFSGVVEFYHTSNQKEVDAGSPVIHRQEFIKLIHVELKEPESMYAALPFDQRLAISALSDSFSLNVDDLFKSSPVYQAIEQVANVERITASKSYKEKAQIVKSAGLKNKNDPLDLLVEKILKESKLVPICKAQSMKQIVYCVVLTPDEIDAQGDWMTAEDIEKAAHYYLMKSRVVGSRHSQKIDSTPVESYIAPQDLEFNGQFGKQIVKKGSWVLAVYVNDPVEWQKVMDGDYTGFSVGGFGQRVPTF